MDGRCRLKYGSQVLIWVAFGGLCVAAATSELPTEILGVSLGMDASEVVQRFADKGIPVLQESGRSVWFGRPLRTVEHIEKVRLFLEEDRLRKVVYYFKLPSPESTATSLLARYEHEQKRLQSYLGPPSRTVTEMPAPEPSDRYEWLALGRGHYLTIWELQEMRITLWLYGGDEGVTLMEMYEPAPAK